MAEQNDQLRNLLSRYADNQATEEEQEQLFSLITASPDEELESSLISILETTSPLYDEARRQRILNKLLQDISKPNGKVVPMKRKPWIKWVAAASVIVVASLIVILSLLKNPSPSSGQAQATHDVPAPTNTRAVITLADGSKVYLDSASNGTIAQQNNVNVVKNDNGEISYTVAANSEQRIANSLSYNTLFNPRGSKVISLTLSDGTKVWLNSESSLRYPASFAPSALNREVEITGEAYFEVKHNSKQPFKVHLPNGSVVEDIGTSFNVNAYTDEGDVKTTLIEGSVRVFANSQQLTANSQQLKPGQQAVINNPANPSILKILVQDNVDVDEVMSWKNGRFTFNGTDIETIMRQVARWYDVAIVYETKPADKFYAEIPRDTKASDVLKALELTNKVHFKIEGKKITVTK
jgi:ferric-dicitrate binding protein FerR (iron transport regulator)